MTAEPKLKRCESQQRRSNEWERVLLTKYDTRVFNAASKFIQCNSETETLQPLFTGENLDNKQLLTSLQQHASVSGIQPNLKKNLEKFAGLTYT